MINYSQEALKALIYAKRKKMGKAVRRRKQKSTSWLYPRILERRYAAQIKAWIKPIKEYVLQYLKEHEADILHGDSANQARADAVPGRGFKTMVNTLYGWAAKYIPDMNTSGGRGLPQIYMGLGKMADMVNNFNDGQWQKSAKESLGIEFPVYEDWWPDMRDSWASENYNMITSSARDYIQKINQRVENAVTNGWSVGQLTESIMKISKKIEATDAARIARDQIAKLNSQATQARMESLGLDLYEWMTAGDERVRGDPAGIYPNARPSHYEMDGRLCRWDDPTLYSEDGGKTWKARKSDWVQLHPGYDYNCRCTAMAYFGELIGEVDAMIDEQE
jgi:hypothetical protein